MCANAAHTTVLWASRSAGSSAILEQMRKILVVEDSPSTRAFVRSTLESETGVPDVEVAEATSGFDALRLLPRGPYDLVITDINMPDINGLELVQFMRKSELHRDTPILLISTQSSERDRQRGLKLGASGYLAKPFAAKALVDEVQRHLRPAGGARHG
jgi:two-component system chemotaxis response regulator CheY